MKKSVFFISVFPSRVFSFFLGCLFCAGQMSAATWYVKPGGNDASAGNSWAAAYQTLTKALQSAASGDQIWVAAGTYKPTTGTDRTISFNMKTGVAILGGFPATGNPVLTNRDWETNVTTLSGDIGTSGDNSDNSYHVVSNFNVGNTAVLDGFTLTAGSSNSNGGGMYCISSSPVINNCRFVSNGAAIFGAGLFCGQNSNVDLNNCFFYSNHAGSVGGGISSQSSSLTISNTVFSGNSGTSGAGLCVQDAPAMVTNCVFSGNSAGNLGGGMLTWNAASFVANCSFSGNQATSLTGGFVNYGTTSATLRNCIIWGNQGSGVANVGGGTALVTYSIVQGGYDGAGNLNINPLFVNAPGDLRLQACSPAINKGIDAAVPAGVTTDLDGNNRFFGTVDMGAYEYQRNTSPLVAACKNLAVQLNASGNVSVPASAADNGSTGCGSLTFYLSQTNFNCSNVGTNNLLFVVSDNNLRSASCAVTVTVQDNTAPTAVCQNTTLQLDASGNASLPTAAINNGSADACGIALLALSKTTFNCSNIGTNSVTLSVTDNNGKTATCSATVTVQDNVAPTAVCKDATVQLDATGNVTVPASAVDNGSVDACGIASLTLSHTSFNCTNVSQAVTLTVTDNHGKTATCTATVTIRDNTLPTAICKNATVQLDASGNVTVPASAMDNGSTDACGIAALTLSKSNFNCSNVGSLLVSLEVRDNNGNKAYCSATITVQDNVAPTAVCQTATIQLDGSGNASIAASAINNGSADACGIASLSLSKTAFDCSNTGINAVTLTVTDNSGKTATCSATVTVQDNAAPTAICQNATIQLDASGKASLTISAINNGSADACGIASLSLSKTAFDCSNIGANTVTLTVTDNSGKTATCSATVTVQDNAAPTAVCQNVTIQLDATGNAILAASALNNGIADACGIASLSLSKTAFDCSNVGANAVTLTVTDNSGKTATCSATVTVQDNIAPTAVCQNTTVQLDATGNATLAPSAVNNGSADACGIASLSLSKTAFDCSNIGANTVTLIVTDNSGKTATCSATVTVQDNAAPTAVCQNTTVQLDATGNATLTASAVNNGSADACGIASLSLSKTAFDCSNTGINAVTLTVTDNNGKTATCSATVTVQDNATPTAVCQNATVQLDASGNASIAASAIDNGSADACGIASLSLSKTAFDCSNIGANTVTLTVTDNSGKTATCSATVTVQDNIAPTAICQNATVQLDASGNASIAASAINNGSTDACGIASLSLSKTAFDCSNTGINAVTLTVTDNSGKTATCSATVTVQDNIAPTAVCQNATVQLDASGNTSISASALNNGSTDACGIASLSLSKMAFDCSNIGANTVTLTVTDNSGKTATCSATVTVQDNAAPTAVCQNATIQLDASGNASIAASALNNGSSDACGITSLSLSKTAFDCSNIGANTVTLTVTDNSGKTATCSATVTVQDNAAPTAVCQNASIQLDASGNASLAASALNNGSSDACGITSLSLSKTAFDCSNIGINTVTLTVTDNSGKTATCSATVTVQDNIAPTVVCKNAAIYLPVDGTANLMPEAIFQSFADNCGTVFPVSLSPNSFDMSNLGPNTITLTVSDVQGNTASCTATLQVNREVTGSIRWKQYPTMGVKEVTVSLSGEQNGSFTTAANGNYSFVLNAGAHFTITPNKNLNKMNGVNAQDVQRLQQHLNGNPITDPWQMLAADVNASNGITAIDANILQLALLGNPSALAQMSKSWRFVPANHVLNNPPWGCPEQIDVSPSTHNFDFYGVKVGDLVAAYANPANSVGQPLVLRAQDQMLEAGEMLTVDLSAGALRDLNALQFALHFDPEVLQVSAIEPLSALPLTDEHFGKWQISEGSLRVVWSDAKSCALTAGTPMLRLRFTVLEGGQTLSEILQLDEATLPGLVFTAAGASAGVSLLYDAVTATQQITAAGLSLDNYPNPFQGQTTVRFELPQACEAQWRITDASGRIVSEYKGAFGAGLHEVPLDLSVSSGVLYIELKTPFGVLVRKMVAAE